MSRPPFTHLEGASQKITDAWARIQQLLRGGLNLHDHVTQNHVISYTHDAGAGIAKTVDITALKLPWAPAKFIVVDIDAAATVHATSADKASWSKTQIVLRCSANNTAIKVMIF